MRLLNIGFGNLVNAEKIVAIVSPDSAPIKRMVQDAKDRGSVVDATYGRKTKAVIITDSNMIVLSAKTAESFENKSAKVKEEKDE